MQSVRRGRRILHLSCHSFTPKLAGVRRILVQTFPR
jgi:predicted N-formylglutamate amidohydrolase